MFDWAALIAALIGAAAGGGGSFWATQQAMKQTHREERRDAVDAVRNSLMTLANTAAQHPLRGYDEDPDQTLHEDVVKASQVALSAIAQLTATQLEKADPVTPWLTATVYQVATAPRLAAGMSRALTAGTKLSQWHAGRIKSKWFDDNPVTTDELGPLALEDFDRPRDPAEK